MKRRIFGTVILGISAAVLVACGGGGDSPVASVTTNMTVTPAKGAIYGALATIYQANGTTSLNTGTTGAVSPATGTVAGAATINVGNYSGVAFVKVTGNATATYYDEKTNSDTASFGTTASLVSAVPAITAGTAGDAGVTPFTTMAAKLAGVDTDTLGTAGAVPAGFTKNTALEGGARVLLALGLPSTYNIFAKPTPATKAVPTPADPLSNILASMGKNTTSASALELFSTMITNTPKASVGTDGTTSLSAAQVTSFTTAFTAFKAAFDTAAASAGITPAAAQLNPSTATLATAVTALDAAVKATTTTTAATTTTTAATTTTTAAATTTTTKAATTTTVASTTTTTKAASGSGSGTGSGSGSGSGTGSF